MQASPAEITVSLTGPFVAHIPVDGDPPVKAHVASAEFRNQVALRAGEFGVKSIDLNWDGELVFNPHFKSNNMTWKTWRQIATDKSVEPQVIIPVKPATAIASPPPDALAALNDQARVITELRTIGLALQRRNEDQEDEIGGLRDTVGRLEGENEELRATNKKIQARVRRLEGENEELRDTNKKLQATVGRVEGELQATVGRLKTERKDYDKLNEKVASLEEDLNAKDRLHSEELKVLDDKIKKQAKTIESLMIPARDVCLRGMLERCSEKLMATLPERGVDETRTAWLERATTDPFVLWVFDQYQAVSKRIHKTCPSPEEAEEVLKGLNQSDKDKDNQLFDYLYPGYRK